MSKHFSQWFKGDQQPPWVHGLVPANPPFDISGLSTSDFTYIFIDTANPDVEIIGTGTFSDLTAASGSNAATITYSPSVVDVGTARTHKRRIVLKRGVAGQQQTFEIDQQTIEL